MLLVIVMMKITNTPIAKLRKAFGNTSSPSIRLQGTQLYIIGQAGGFLGRIR